MNMMQVNSQIVGGLGQIELPKVSALDSKSNGINALEIKTNNKHVYASKGEYKYNKDMDTDNDGSITFSEYAKYISEQSFAQNDNLKSLYNLTKYTKTTDAESGLRLLTVFNYGKALRTYINSSANLPTSLINAKG